VAFIKPIISLDLPLGTRLLRLYQPLERQQYDARHFVTGAVPAHRSLPALQNQIPLDQAVREAQLQLAESLAKQLGTLNSPLTPAIAAVRLELAFADREMLVHEAIMGLARKQNAGLLRLIAQTRASYVAASTTEVVSLSTPLQAAPADSGTCIGPWRARRPRMAA
jgi:hypothetical protein